MMLQLDIGQFSHAGRKRAHNEDWLGAFQPEDPDRLARKGRLFLVADGMGGHRGGELASRRAVDRVIRAYVDDPDADPGQSLRRAITEANALLHSQTADEEGRERWGTTLVAAVVRGDKLWIANVGDSRAYLLRNGQLRQLSRDHSLAAEIGVSAGENWIGRHVITRALGLKPEVEVDVFAPLRLRVGDRILLCSDGLTTPLSDDEIRAIAGRGAPQAAAEALIQAANERGGPDNVSVILIAVTGRERGAPRSLLHPATWQAQAADLLTGKGLRWPILLAIVLLLVLAVVGLGFILGLLIFHKIPGAGHLPGGAWLIPTQTCAGRHWSLPIKCPAL